ncbi:p-aminobenzoyl-glutamate hydrolase subunit B [Cladorrhinum samala]|uniref:Peptidase M20 domain-containing protein 2 n=1 Tax=Cladorrhinum samala TaxID=585594 RepID=A0AAV9I5K5_9PEZI|nr:p-aminobenzoyl-glutamate hydrolase subunit B [Cladorrhinum samala]
MEANIDRLINDEIDNHAPKSIKHVNLIIHANPELAYEEHKAHELFVSTLKELGHTVTPHAYGLDTAFETEYGSGGRLVIFNAEYDALPGIGHACGHNLIASASFAAFLGVAAALAKSGLPGRVRLLGTPAEEGGGGKLKLIEAGAFRDASACLMVHPGPGHNLPPSLRGASYINMLANVKMRVYFTGHNAHAAIAPWEGVNALDAVCLSYNAISMLRQQIRPDERIHGIVQAGGERPNVIPANCCLEYYIRSATRKRAQTLWERAKKCFEGAALATGCEVRFEELNSYSDLRPSPLLCKAYVEAMPSGTVAYDELSDFLGGSTDMGDVCYQCPSFHGAFGIETKQGEANHTKGFTAAAGTEDSFERAMECGKGMASVAWKVLTDDVFADQIKSDWEADMVRAGEE